MNDISTVYTQSLQAMAPEILLVVGIIFAALWNVYQPRHKGWTPTISMALLIVAFVLLCQQFAASPKQLLFYMTDSPGLFTADRLTACFGLLACLFGGVVVLMTMGYEHHFGENRGEYYALLLTSVLAVLLCAGSTDLIMLFVSLETLTLAGVLLSGYAKRDRFSNEASLKYLLSTAATTATFLYGLSFLYGISGSTNYYTIAQSIAIKAQSPSLLIIFLLVLMLSVIGFKLSMVPFHMWTPDVYEGAPTPVSAYLSVISKLGGFVVAVRLLSVMFEAAVPIWAPILGVLAIFSMIAGNFMALPQTSLKRLLAYSSIAHVGYLLIGLTANSPEGLSSMIFYLVVYGFMNLGAFTGAVLFENETGTDNIEDMCGLIKKRPWLAIGLSVCLLNLAGLPVPPAGFLAKVFIFWSGFQMGTPLGLWLVVVALATSVPAIYYYSKVVINMVVREPSRRVSELPDTRHRVAEPETASFAALAVAVAGVVVATIWVNPIMAFSNMSAAGITRRAATSMVPQHTDAPRIGVLPSSNLR